NDVYTAPAHNLKVFSNMSRKGLKFLGNKTPLFPNMLIQAEGKGSIPHDSPLLGGRTSDRAKGALNLEELFYICTNFSNMVLSLETVNDAQAAKIIALKARIKKLEKKCKPSISHHRSWLKSVQRLSMKKRFRKKESISKQGRKKDKPESTLDEQEEEASKAAIAEMYDEVQVGIEADALFVAKLQQEEREEYTIEERTKFLAKTIVAQRRFGAAQRSAEIRSRPPTKSPLRNLMMTNLKNMGGYKHSRLKEKTFAEVEVKQEGDGEIIRKRPGKRHKMKATKKSKRQKTDSDLKEEEHLKTILKIVIDKEGEADYEVLDKRFPIINWKSKFYHLDRHGAECMYYRIFRSDGSSRWIKTLLKW
nr:hypothetical protein [Tanacetum cinerariifolium]